MIPSRSLGTDLPSSGRSLDIEIIAGDGLGLVLNFAGVFRWVPVSRTGPVQNSEPVGW